MIQYQKSITSAHWNRFTCLRIRNRICHWRNAYCHIHPPLLLSVSPLLPLPTPHGPLQDTSLIQAKGQTLKQSLPLISAWLLGPQISVQCAWYLSTGCSSLIKIDTDRRVWISSEIMCLLRITQCFLTALGTKGNCLWNSQGQRSCSSFFCL